MITFSGCSSTLSSVSTTDADYIIKNDSNHTITFPPGEREKTIDLTIVDDIYDEPNKSFSILLENARGGADIGSLNKHTVVIIDNDIPYFSFVNAAMIVGEGAGKVSIPVKLSNPSLGPLGIRYNISNTSSAIAGKDYAPFSTDTAIFSAGASLLSIDLPAHYQPPYNQPE
ncbi:MAG TPA: Calx-beta domain-containing protein [Chitinispirillaceae bacterium]|nr:Calx-beta domain-containing protein [Chitinispirillaceae bacterium]